jgi:N-acetyl-gamma-glutamyl-phosphate reductase
LLNHPDVELTHVYAGDNIGLPLSAALPNLEGKTDLHFLEVPADGHPPPVDILMLALPHPVSHRVVKRALKYDVRIIDMSGAFRVDDPVAYKKFYGEDHPMPELLTSFKYGLPELNRAELRGTRFVASPGCFATAIELSMVPLARAGWLSGPLYCTGITGSSGAGHNPTRTTHHAMRMSNLRVYKPLTHTHAPEIKEALTRAGGTDLEVDFVPVAAPLSRGILATSFTTLPGGVSAEDVAKAYADSYDRERFVVVPKGRLPELLGVVRSNCVEVGFAIGELDSSGRRPITCIAAIDNLVKGGAGQAVQNLNLMLELEESTALTDLASFP